MKQSQASIKRSLKNLRMIIDSETVDPITKRMAYFAECTLRWSTEDTDDWQRPEVDLEDEVALLLKEVAQQDVKRTACYCCRENGCSAGCSCQEFVGDDQ